MNNVIIMERPFPPSFFFWIEDDDYGWGEIKFSQYVHSGFFKTSTINQFWGENVTRGTGRGLDRTVTCEFMWIQGWKTKKTTLFHPTMTHNMYLFGEFWNPAYSIEEIKLNSHLGKLERVQELVSVLQGKEVADPRHIVLRVFMPEEIGVAWMLTELARYINYILLLTWWEHFLFPVWSLWPQLWRIFSDPR